jgi:6-pyruvoyl-tetrahydropterin synthase
MYQIEVRAFFCAAHKLPDTVHLVSKACASLHGHTYLAIVTCSRDVLEGGMVIDFKAVKNLIEKHLDHSFINDVFAATPGWEQKESTAEHIARFIQEKIKEELKLDASVRLCEGYKGEASTNWVSVFP